MVSFSGKTNSWSDGIGTATHLFFPVVLLTAQRARWPVPPQHPLAGDRRAAALSASCR